jgi:site-specific DNA-methyltransferase (adenine-specific)
MNNNEIDTDTDKLNEIDTDTGKLNEIDTDTDTNNNNNNNPPLQLRNIVFNECCLIGMNRIPDDYIDLICTDLPYGLSDCGWDININLNRLWKQYKRVLKPYGTIILFGKQPFTSKLVMSNDDMFKYSLVWEKSRCGCFAQAPYRILNNHEDILIFSNGKFSKNAKHKMIYHPQGIKKCNKLRPGVKGNCEHRKNRKDQPKYIQKTTNYPKSVLKFADKGKRYHSTQKPIQLIEYLIKTFSNEESIVLDSCMGGGTTAIACINTNRHYIGFEVNHKYFQILTQRISKRKKKQI